MDERTLNEQCADLFRQARRLSRREVMRRGLALGLSTPIIATMLAACGDDDDSTEPTVAPTASGSEPTSADSGEATAPAESSPDTGSTGDTAWYVDPAPGDPVSGGTINYLLYEDPDSMNPYIGQTSIASQVTTVILEPLAETLPNGDWSPVLAAEIPTLENGGISEDLLTVTWKLREGVLWHDGEPFTSDDVKFSYEAASDVDAGSAFASEFEKVASVETPDDLTVIVTYSEFNPAYVDQFKYIIPRHATGEISDMMNWDFNRNPVGTGPFKFEEWAAADHITVVKNEDYREEGKPYLDAINFLVVPSEESRSAQMLQGDAHVMLWPGSEASDKFRNSDVVQTRIAPGIWTVAMRFNLSKPFDNDAGVEPPHPLFGDPEFRKAIGFAINRDRIANEVLNDSVIIDSVLSVGWIMAEVDTWVYDPDEAASILDAAGWKLNGDVREKDGVKAEFVCNGYTGYLPNELQQLAIQEDLAKVGITMKIENQDFAVIFGTWADGSPRMTGDFDALFYDDGFFIEPHNSIVLRYHPDSVPSESNPSGQNFIRWVRKDVGEWLDAAGSTPDRDIRRENYQKVAEAMREDAPVIPIVQFTEGNAYSTRLHGFVVSTWEYSTWDAENWWLES